MLLNRSYACIVLLAVIHAVAGLHIYMKPGEVKCFYEGLSSGNLLLGDVDTAVDRGAYYEEDPDVDVTITIDETFDNDHRVMNQKTSNTGEFAFSALETGEHRICITPSYSKDKNAKLRVFIEFDISNVRALDSKRKEDVSYLRNRVNQLISRVQRIKTEQDVIREKEAIFRDQSEAVNSKIMFWSVIQLLVLGGVCIFQLRYLKNFFVKQKVV